MVSTIHQVPLAMLLKEKNKKKRNKMGKKLKGSVFHWPNLNPDWPNLHPDCAGRTETDVHPFLV